MSETLESRKAKALVAGLDMLCEAMQAVTPHEHKHCWHDYRGAIWMVIPDGHIVQKCCKCSRTRVNEVTEDLVKAKAKVAEIKQRIAEREQP